MPRRCLAVVAGDDPECERLSGEVLSRLPNLPPVALERRPLDAPVPLHRRRRHVAGAADVGDGDHVEVLVAGDGVPDAALPHARDAPVRHRHDPGLLLRDLQERRHAQVEMLPRRVAPPAIVAGLLQVGRAQVRRRHHHHRRRRRRLLLLLAPAIVDASELVAAAARRAVAVEGRAHRRSLQAVALGGRVLVAARARRRAGPVATAVEGGVGGLPWPRRELAVVVVNHFFTFTTARRQILHHANCRYIIGRQHHHHHHHQRRPPRGRHD
ncbi:hypothetical protein PR202_ga21821 [Eleusine coracana subsp. coracana]|uniref:Uncharacterized protein n=1 Tax=Eleusine coracana subsp. coracana TaxID=191504 RepID=A0AAV5D2L9_ELECO|nr:hypothetical protein PR202_ga21821 [Eleusine coracana subsp. coracana]